jgi:hypothetical protein
MAGIGLGLGWVIAGEVAIRRIARRHTTPAGAEWAALAESVRVELALGRSPHVLESAAAVVPLTFGWFRPAVVVPRSGRSWSEAHRRAVLTHELAHIRRHDCMAHFLTRAACAVHWYNPLAWIAVRQARIERELACDDAVLECGSMPSGYAAALLETALVAQDALAAGGAGLAMARRSEITRRLTAILEPHRRRGTVGPKLAAGLLSMTGLISVPLATLAPAESQAGPVAETAHESPLPSEASLSPVRSSQSAPAPAASTPNVGLSATENLPPVGATPEPSLPAIQAPSLCPRAPDGRGKTVHLSSSMTITGQGDASDGKNHFIVWTGEDCSVVARATSDFHFNTDETDFLAPPDGSRVSVTHTQGDRTRVYEVWSEGGTTRRSYTVNGAAAATDGEFEQWRNTIILELARRNSSGAEERARRILSQRGLDGVLEEITFIPSSYAQSRYYRVLFAMGAVGPSAVARVLRMAGSISSSYELSQILSAVPDSLLASEPARQAYLEAARHIGSDYEKQTVLLALLDRGAASDAVTSTVIQLAGSIKSSYERYQVLSSVLKHGVKSPTHMTAVLQAAQGIGSAYELSQLLGQLTESVPLDGPVRGAFFTTAQGVNSAHELYTTLSAAVSTNGQKVTADVLQLAPRIRSDYELAELLVQVARKGLTSDEERRLYQAAAESIRSQYERQRAQAAAGLASL